MSSDTHVILSYDHSVDSYAYAELRLRPTCIIGPKSVDDVSKAIKTLVQFPSVKFAVRSGGFANIENGITIDLGALNAVEVSDDRHTVSIGMGARWRNVYETVERHGHLSVQGGRVSSVGTGGYITGGGIGYFSPDKVWVCDSVKDYDVVLADRSMVRASAESYADLFKALKGGANNFGTVTRFTLETIDQDDMTGGTFNYGNVTGEQVLDTVTCFKEADRFDKYSMLLVFIAYEVDQAAFSYSASFYHARPEKFRGSTSEDFTKIEPRVSQVFRNATAGFFANQTVFDPATDPSLL
ncbi:hypothetical protein N0V90_009982 [Kalmusia sp. IMI 367209]|nr:hypothetical protein N0V90_009982 [Kalmusia sp. IMI 367209]